MSFKNKSCKIFQWTDQNRFDIHVIGHSCNDLKIIIDIALIYTIINFIMSGKCQTNLGNEYVYYIQKQVGLHRACYNGRGRCIGPT